MKKKNSERRVDYDRVGTQVSDPDEFFGGRGMMSDRRRDSIEFSPNRSRDKDQFAKENDRSVSDLVRVYEHPRR